MPILLKQVKTKITTIVYKMPIFSIEESLSLLVILTGLYMLSEALTVLDNYHKKEIISDTEIEIQDFLSEQGYKTQEDSSSDTETDYEELKKPQTDIDKFLEKIPTLF
jgi:hypothetical protein